MRERNVDIVANACPTPPTHARQAGDTAGQQCRASPISMQARREAVETHGRSTETPWDDAIGARHRRTASHARGGSSLGCPLCETRGARQAAQRHALQLHGCGPRQHATEGYRYAHAARATGSRSGGVAGGALVRSGVAPCEKKCWRRVWPCRRRVRLQGEGIHAQ